MSEKAILEKLDTMDQKVDKKLEDMRQEVSEIKNVVGKIAVQAVQINNLSDQVASLWKKHDEAFGPTGVVNQVQQFQASCPRVNLKENMERSQKRLWGAVGIIGTMMAGGVLKAFGAF